MIGFDTIGEIDIEILYACTWGTLEEGSGYWY